MESVQYHLKCKQNEVNQAVLLPGDIERADYIGTHFFKNSVKIAENREFHIYNGNYENKSVAVCSTGIGCMSAAVAIEELIHIGCKYYIRIGTGQGREGLDKGYMYAFRVGGGKSTA